MKTPLYNAGQFVSDGGAPGAPSATDGPMLARAWADSGKVTGWYVEKKKPTGEGGGRKRA